MSHNISPSFIEAPDRNSQIELPRVGISILNWNGADSTIECLKSVFSLTYRNFFVVVVDNGSNDGSVHSIRQAFPNVDILENAVNQGFTGGHNRAMEYAFQNGATFVWLLNNDTVVCPSSLTRLVLAATENPRVGLISPVIYYADRQDAIQFCGARIDRVRQKIVVSRDPDEIRFFARRSPTDIVLWGTAMLVKKEVAQAIGLLDDRYFAYYEDMDYCVRAINADFLCRVSFDASVWHRGHPSVNTRPEYFFYLMARNALLFWWTHIGWRVLWRFVPAHVGDTLVYAGNCRARGFDAGAASCLAGLWDAATARYGPRDGTRSMPQWVAKLLMRRPYLFAMLLHGNFRALYRVAKARIFAHGIKSDHE